jgi:phenylalanyl-tRNA synthetase alpha subunit
MGVNSEFADKLQNAGNNQKILAALMADIDNTKRAIKSALSQLSSEPDERHARGRERQAKIRRMKDKISFLTEESGVVKERLGRLKMDKKALNRAASSKKLEFAHAFMAAAERILTEKQFNEIEYRASDIIQSK